MIIWFRKYFDLQIKFQLIWVKIGLQRPPWIFNPIQVGGGGDVAPSWFFVQQIFENKYFVWTSCLAACNLILFGVEWQTNTILFIAEFSSHYCVCHPPSISVKWEAAKIVGRERKTTQRKFLEGIMTLKEGSKERIPLNAYNQMEPWQPTVFSFLRNWYRKKHCVCHLHEYHGSGTCKNCIFYVVFSSDLMIMYFIFRYARRMTHTIMWRKFSNK